MIEVSILIPVADNSGDPFTPDHFATFEAFLLERFGGMTRATDTVEGLWMDSSITYRDTLVVYLVGVASVLQEADKLTEACTFAKRHFHQEAVYIRYLGVADIV